MTKQRDKFEKFTERARKVLTLAQEEAHRFGHSYIGTEHILLGLVREEQGVAARVLSGMGVTLPKVRTAVEHIIGRGDAAIVGEIGLTPRAKKVMELAVDEARSLHHHYIGTEHLLLGLIREGEGIAAGVLQSMGINLNRAREEVLRVLNQGPLPTAEPLPQERQHDGARFVSVPTGAGQMRVALIALGASIVASLLIEHKPRLAASLMTGFIAGFVAAAFGNVTPWRLSRKTRRLHD